MVAVEIFPLLIFFGLIMSVLFVLKQKLGSYSWILSIVFVAMAIAIFVFALFKRTKFSKMFPHKYALTIALTIISILLIFAFGMLPLKAKAQTTQNWCAKDKDWQANQT